MDYPPRSDTAISELQRGLEDPAERTSTLCFVQLFTEDARLLLPTLVKLLESLSDTTDDAEEVAKCLAAAGEPAVPALINALKSRNPSVREYAALALSRMGSPARSAVPALIERFADEDATVARNAFGAIGGIGPDAKEAVPALIEVLRGTSARRRISAACALEHIGPAAKAAVPALISVLRERATDDQSRYARYQCICALMAMGLEAKPAVPTLLTLLKQDTGNDLGLNEQAVAMRALQESKVKSKDVIEAVTAYLSSPDAWVRVGAAEALWGIEPGSQAAFDVLVKELKSDDEHVRGQAAFVVSEFGGRAKAALPQLRVMLSQDPSETNRSVARIAIEKITGAPPQP